MQDETTARDLVRVFAESGTRRPMLISDRGTMIKAPIGYSEVWAPGRTGPDFVIGTITLPVRTVSESNARGHWSARAKRAREQRGATRLVCGAPLAKYRSGLRDGSVHHVFVRLVRVAPRQLDDDNLRAALKAIRDGVTDALGLASDRDDRLTWTYYQRQQAKTYAVDITVWSEVRA